MNKTTTKACASNNHRQTNCGIKVLKRSLVTFKHLWIEIITLLFYEFIIPSLE